MGGVHVFFTESSTQTMQYDADGNARGPALYQVSVCRLCGAKKSGFKDNTWHDPQRIQPPERVQPSNGNETT